MKLADSRRSWLALPPAFMACTHVLGIDRRLSEGWDEQPQGPLGCPHANLAPTTGRNRPDRRYGRVQHRRCGRLASDHSLRHEVGPKGIDYLTDPLLDLVLLHAGTVEPRSDGSGHPGRPGEPVHRPPDLRAAARALQPVLATAHRAARSACTPRTANARCRQYGSTPRSREARSPATTGRPRRPSLWSRVSSLRRNLRAWLAA